MNKPKSKPLTGGGNLAFAQAMHGKHNLTHNDKRTKRNRDRGAQRRNSIKEQM